MDGIVARHGTVGAVEKSITIDPLRECTEAVPLDGPDGILHDIPAPLRQEFDSASLAGTVGACSNAVWQSLESALRAARPELDPLLDWLIAQADPPVFGSSPADQSWQEQRDATGSLLRIADFPLSALAAWRRPQSGDAPYTAGLIPQPVEHSAVIWQQLARTHVPFSGRRGVPADVGSRLDAIATELDMPSPHASARPAVQVLLDRLAGPERYRRVERRLALAGEFIGLRPGVGAAPGTTRRARTSAPRRRRPARGWLRRSSQWLSSFFSSDAGPSRPPSGGQAPGAPLLWETGKTIGAGKPAGLRTRSSNGR
jgi:hypothetical protein